LVDALSAGVDDALPVDWTSERAREVDAIMRLQCIPGVGTRTLWRVLERFGSGVAALEASSAQLNAAAGSKAAASLRASGLKERVDDAMQRCIRSGMRVLTWRDPQYPVRMLHLADPPPLLFGQGDIRLLSRPAVTVVGSRRSTPYGRRVAERLAAELSRHGVLVVSGLALGIDGAAHRGALEAGGDTIAVLGSGVDLIQPSTHRALGQRIAREGLLLSEFLPGEPAQAYHFPCRNRILAALGGAVVVVEAAARSGAFITVEHASDIGRDVYAVPGPVDSLQSRGSNDLLRQGARVVVSVADFVRDLDLSGADPTTSKSSQSAGARAGEPRRLTPVARRVWSGLNERPLRVEEFARAARLESSNVLAVLTELELSGWVLREAGMRFRKTS
jgi:DNA processing protein